MPPKRASVLHEDSGDEMGHEDGMPMQMEKFFNPNYSTKFMSTLPKSIRERAQVLMIHHEKYEKLRKEFEDKETALRRRYDEIYLPFYERRKEIVSGTGNSVTDEEVSKGFPEEHKNVIDIVLPESEAEKMKEGLPDFWLRALEHHVLPGSLIEEHDKEVLSYLLDVRSGVIEGGYGSIAVAFVFKPNPFIEEETLVISLTQQEEGTKILRSPLTWKKGKDVTKTTVTKKLRAKRGAPARSHTVTVSRPSFFTIFKESEASGESDENEDSDDDEGVDDEQVEQLLEVLHTAVIPNAVQCYTGEAPDGNSDLESDDEEDEEDEDDEDDDEKGPEAAHRGRGGRRGRGDSGARGGRAGLNSGDGNAPECKQQ